MKKIAIVTNSTWNIYNFRLPLIRKLQSYGYKIVIISPIDSFLPLIKKDTTLKHIPLLHLSSQSKNPIKDLSLIYELKKKYTQENLDFILHYTIKPNIYGSIAAHWVGIPCISTITGLGYTFLTHNFTTRLVKILYRFALRNNYKVIFHNNDDKNLFIQKRIVQETNVEVIKGSGVDTTFFYPIEKKERKNEFIFLFIGRLLYDKGIIEYINAAKKINQSNKLISCWVLGELNAKNPSAISKTEINDAVKTGIIKYLGTTKKIKDIIQSVDAIVLPSYREGMPKAVLEAMAMGKPIITTKTAGCREAIDDNINGFLVPIKNAEALAEAMKKMYLLDAHDLKIMGIRSREKVIKEFDEEIINERYLNLINKYLAD